MGVIYTATFPNGFKYVGQTSQKLKHRISQHKSEAKVRKVKDNEKTIVFYNAINKYGFDCLVWEVIDFYDTKKEGNEKERYWIRELHTFIHDVECRGYNTTTGGNSRRGTSKLTEQQLIEVGEYYRQDVTAEKVAQIMKVDINIIYGLYRGDRFTEFTKIPVRPDYIPHATVYKPKHVDEILQLFKETGNISEVTRIFVSTHNFGSKASIRDIIKGITWSEYTQIYDEKFFEQYRQPHNKKKIVKEGNKNLTKDEILTIYKMGKQGISIKQISETMHKSCEIVRGIVKEYHWTNITQSNK